MAKMMNPEKIRAILEEKGMPANAIETAMEGIFIIMGGIPDNQEGVRSLEKVVEGFLVGMEDTEPATIPTREDSPSAITPRQNYGFSIKEAAERYGLDANKMHEDAEKIIGEPWTPNYLVCAHCDKHNGVMCEDLLADIKAVDCCDRMTVSAKTIALYKKD